MRDRGLARVAWLIVMVTLGGACSAAPTASAPAASVVLAVTFDDYAVAMCSAFDSMFQAIGNPDTGSGSELSKELDRAVERKDGAAANRLAALITTKLELGRQQAAAAASWPSAGPMMAQLDRVLGAFVVMIAAKRNIANGVPAAIEPQAAFEQAGGAVAWFAMFEAGRSIVRPTGAPGRQCPTVPVTP